MDKLCANTSIEKKKRSIDRPGPDARIFVSIKIISRATGNTTKTINSYHTDTETAIYMIYGILNVETIW